MSFEIVCFDCDSTLSKIEGIDELAKRAGVGVAIACLTDAAMNGDMLLERVYEERLSLIKPDQGSIEWLSNLYIEQLVDGVEAVFEGLREHNKQIHILSGGIRQAILPMARYLQVPESHVHAVDIYFDENGSYRHFDWRSPLARSGGKAEVCRALTQQSNTLVMIGDGKTDLEVQQSGSVVIGFGGVVERPVVRDQADFFCAGPSLESVMAYIL